MKYRVIGTGPGTRRSVSVLSLGAMLMGTRTDEETSFAILDRYVAAGGTFIDTSGNYAFWVNGTQGGESEELLGRWRRSRGISDVVIATKVGARPLAPSFSFGGPPPSLTFTPSSSTHLGVRVLVLRRGRLLGVSNHWSWRVVVRSALAPRSAAVSLPPPGGIRSELRRGICSAWCALRRSSRWWRIRRC